VNAYTYIIGLGGNIAPRQDYLRQALAMLEKEGTVLRVSPFYETAPWGVTDQPAFLNAAALWQSDKTPGDVLHFLKQTESALGRLPARRWGPRRIDLDIIDYDGPEVHTENLHIPHAAFSRRLFVLIPMRDILPEYQNREGRTIQTLIKQCSDKGSVKPYTGERHVPHAL